MLFRVFHPRIGKRVLCGILVALMLFACLALRSSAQVGTAKTPQATKPAGTPVVDPLGRTTPMGSVMGLLKYEERGDFATAARYLEATADAQTDLVRSAEQLHALGPRFKGNVSLLSDNPEGTIEAGLSPGHVRAGVIAVGDMTAEVTLVRVDDPEFGKIWLLSQETVAQVPELYARMQSEAPSKFNKIMPGILTRQRVLGMSVAQWFGWLLSIPLSGTLAWLLSFVISAPGRMWRKLQNRDFQPIWKTPLGMPLRAILAIAINCGLVYSLHPLLLYRVYYFRFMAALLVGCFAWLASRIMDRGFDSAVTRTRTQNQGGESILILMQRLARVLMLVIAIVAALALFGINVTTTLAGLGIGGLAIALAAQKTFENIFGGISLLMDGAVHVGDFCSIGGKLGTVEDVGLRSIKLRTLDQNLLVVPNGALAQMQFENMKARPKLLLDQIFSLRIETKVDQLRSVMERVQAMLDRHPSIESGTSRIRINEFAGAAFKLELWAYAKTGDWGEFTGIRQDVILKIAEIVETAGARFAAPTNLTYLSSAAEPQAEMAASAGAG